MSENWLKTCSKMGRAARGVSGAGGAAPRAAGHIFDIFAQPMFLDFLIFLLNHFSYMFPTFLIFLLNQCSYHC